MIKEKRAKRTLRSCRKNQTLLVSRSAPYDVFITVSPAFAEEEEDGFGSIASTEEEQNGYDYKSFTSVEGEKPDDGSIETIECDDDVLPFDIEDYLE